MNTNESVMIEINKEDIMNLKNTKDRIFNSVISSDEHYEALEIFTINDIISRYYKAINNNTQNNQINPDKISIDIKLITMNTLIDRIIKLSIYGFESNKKIWTLERKSRLIESLMLNIPLPTFYVLSDKKGNWFLMDGLQRLITFKEFILSNEFLHAYEEKIRGEGFKLQNLEFLNKYNNKNFNELPEFLKNRIFETEFRFVVINPGTPEEVTQSIFNRINS